MENSISITPFIFYFFAALAVGSAIMVIVLRNPLYSAVMLVVTFFSMAGIYVQLKSEVIAVFQVLVYAGAIMVLVIFVIMLLDLRESSVKSDFAARVFRPSIVVLLCIIFFVALVWVFSDAGHFMEYAKKGAITQKALAAEGGFALFSRALFSEYLLPFELVSLLLTVAIIGVVVLIRGMHPVQSTGRAATQGNAKSTQKRQKGGQK